jgi:4-amino-4-deoxy-L-arabinose transferase-like glycosyltransferase
MTAPRILLYVVAVAFAVFTYFYGLDSQHIPKNGDEYPYEHIARLTAASGHWLPLQSELDNMRNTKPPLLIWQGILSTHRGSDWSLWNLRYPGVIYTLLTAALLFLLGRKLAGAETGFAAFLIYLAFFSTYHYGRPFLINPAEVFWFFLPFAALLYWERAFDSRVWAPLLMGGAIGIGLLYKSFALIAPVGAALVLWHLQRRDFGWLECLKRDALKVAMTVVVALAIFALWFAFDPDPQAVWREFVVGENAGKFDPHGESYFSKFLWGGSSVWAMLLGYPLNAGLLAVPVVAVAFAAWKGRWAMGRAEKMLWLLVLAFLVVFSLPSQRSSRYLLEAMPALALLCALYWGRLGRGVLIASLVMSGAALAFIAFVSYRLQQEVPALYGVMHWGLLGVAFTLVLVAFLVPKTTAVHAIVAALFAVCCFASLLKPFDGDRGNYSRAAQDAVMGKTVGVPCDFRAKPEGYRFILPGSEPRGYREGANGSMDALAAQYKYFAMATPLAQPVTLCRDCKVLGERLDIRGRQSDEEIKQILQGNVFQYLFAKELLVESPAAANAAPAEECR